MTFFKCKTRCVLNVVLAHRAGDCVWHLITVSNKGAPRIMLKKIIIFQMPFLYPTRKFAPLSRFNCKQMQSEHQDVRFSFICGTSSKLSFVLINGFRRAVIKFSIFSSYVGSGPASTVHPLKISGITSTPPKIRNFSNPKNIPHSVP